ncbi:hypothetical protein SAMN02745746_02456 [Pseudogulbenkiania subflava DSM 22618]|uniref:Uncharacterized protein n=2 Tax=Pseudogulbenkiania subflava TaxID=451637 RepID=A0A1Y6BXT6_9NEIS|nr:hypothetical protein SAMN02745746_02456 [Pseudogulbenkiania subflava DSM 22618]
MDSNCFGRRRKAPRTHSSATAMTPGGDKRPLLTFFRLLLTTLLLVLGASPAFATDPSHVNFTLEGCRNDGSITFPVGGPFVCPDAAYTTGNLGKGWNELDLVPHRVTAAAGNSAPSNQIYTIAVVADNLSGTAPGYDVVSVPVLNTSLSSGSCTAPTVGAQTNMTPGLGGLDQSIFRLVTITQAKNTTCVYDYYERLALGSHLFPGSSLHSNLALPTGASTVDCSGLGCRDVSIPVKEILPQELRKDMSAKQDTDFTWNITKEANPTKVSFGNVCSKDFSDQKPVEITITWTKSAAIPGVVTVTTNVYAKNPASRTITVNVTDKIYKGTTQANLLDTANSGDKDVPAATELLVLTHTKVLLAEDGSDGSLNDVATATYIDKATGIAVPGNTEAKASATIGTGTTTNATAVITDTESISGNFLKFSVDSLGGSVSGSFNPAYTLGTQTTGPVGWTSGEQSTSGSVVFNKTIHLAGQKITSGTLTDTATLTPKDGTAQVSGPVNVTINSDASAELTIKKSIDAEAMSFLGTGEKYVIKFTITRLGDASYKAEKELTFNPGDASPKSVVLDSLVPDTYLVTEEALFVNASNVSTSGVIADPSGSQRTVNLNVVDSSPTCTGTAEFNNKRAFGPATAQVQKITDPTQQSGDDGYAWTFTLTGPGTGSGVTAVANAGQGYVTFQVGGGQPFSLSEGSYTVTETTKADWDLNSVNGDTTLKTCTFTVDYPADASKVFSCTFKNIKRAQVQVIKTFQGLPITGSEAFTFSLRTGASASSDGTKLQTLVASSLNGGTIAFDKVVPGTYQLCEEGVLPGWTATLASLPGAFFPPNGGDNSTVCVGFTLNAGDFKQITLDNAPPPGGNARTIGYWKNWSSCKQSNGKQAPVLDQTMASAEPTGIQVDSFYLHGSVATPNTAPDCSKAVSLLNKSTFSGTKKASDPLFNMTAQLVGAELNYAAGAAKCAKVTDAIKQANDLLTKYQFTGNSYTGKLSAADASLANSLATRLDNYNNNLPSACQ